MNLVVAATGVHDGFTGDALDGDQVAAAQSIDHRATGVRADQGEDIAAHSERDGDLLLISEHRVVRQRGEGHGAIRHPADLNRLQRTRDARALQRRDDVEPVRAACAGIVNRHRARPRRGDVTHGTGRHRVLRIADRNLVVARASGQFRALEDTFQILNRGRRSVEVHAGLHRADHEQILEQRHIRVARLDQGVVAGLVDERVEPRAARHLVVAGSAVDAVCEGGAGDSVVAITCDDLERQQIAARHAAGVHRVVAALAVDHQRVALATNAVVDGELTRTLRHQNARASRIRAGRGVECFPRIRTGDEQRVRRAIVRHREPRRLMPATVAHRADDGRLLAHVHADARDTGASQIRNGHRVRTRACIEPQRFKSVAGDRSGRFEQHLACDRARLDGQRVRRRGAGHDENITAGRISDYGAEAIEAQANHVVVCAGVDRIRAAAAGNFIRARVAEDLIRARAAKNLISSFIAVDDRCARTRVRDVISVRATVYCHRAGGLDIILALIAIDGRATAALINDGVIATATINRHRHGHAGCHPDAVVARAAIRAEAANVFVNPRAAHRRHLNGRVVRRAANLLDDVGFVRRVVRQVPILPARTHVQDEVAAVPRARVTRCVTCEVNRLRQLDVAHREGRRLGNRGEPEINLHRHRKLNRHAARAFRPELEAQSQSRQRDAEQPRLHRCATAEQEAVVRIAGVIDEVFRHDAEVEVTDQPKVVTA